MHQELLDKLMVGRDIKLTPEWEVDLHDPFLMRDMGKAVDRVNQAILNNQKIIIFADYDADGVPGAAAFHHFFNKIGYHNFGVYIPDRYQDGRGLSNQIVDELKSQGANLIVTIDCGISNVAEVDYASTLGVDVVITDHHLPHATGIPRACAVVNNKRLDDQYPFKYLCGAATAFKLIQALGQKHFNLNGWEKWLLDLVAISTISDMMPLTGENRVIVYYGLQVLRQTRNLGLKVLMKQLGIKPYWVSEDDVGFLIAPRINTASRMSHGSRAFDLLTTKNEDEAEQIATHLEEKNLARREMVEVMITDAQSQLDEASLPPLIALGQDDWSTGVLSLGATRLVERYGRPACLWGVQQGEYVKGSCRSDGTVNVLELMREAGGDDYFVEYGGHAHAGGFFLKRDRQEALAERLVAAYGKLRSDKPSREKPVDAEVSIDEVDSKLYSVVERLAPFGRDNPKPVFLIKNIEIKNSKLIGNGALHWQIDFQNSRGKTICATAFFSNDKFPGVSLAPGARIDLLANLERTHFRGFPELRLRVVDIKTTL